MVIAQCWTVTIHKDMYVYIECTAGLMTVSMFGYVPQLTAFLERILISTEWIV